MHKFVKSYAQIFQTTLEIQTAGFRIKISVLLYRQAGMLKNWYVIAPGWGGHINFTISLPEFAEKGSAYTQSASATDCLMKEAKLKELIIIWH